MDITELTLDQLQAFVSVVDEGGYAKAADALGKGQSAVSYAIQKLESSLGMRLFALRGRKAALTPAGEILLPQARHILAATGRLQRQASALARGVEPVLRVAIEAILPRALLLDTLTEFAQGFPVTRVELLESILSGTHEALLANKADLIVTGVPPTGHAGERFGRIEFRCLTSPAHPLQQLGRAASLDDLREHRQIVVRDSGSYRRFDAPWLEAGQRWTVSSLDTSLEALRKGLGFAWFPLSIAREALQRDELQAVHLQQAMERSVDLFLVYRDPACTGPACRAFAAALIELVNRTGAGLGVQPIVEA